VGRIDYRAPVVIVFGRISEVELVYSRIGSRIDDLGLHYQELERLGIGCATVDIDSWRLEGFITWEISWGLTGVVVAVWIVEFRDADTAKGAIIVVRPIYWIDVSVLFVGCWVYLQAEGMLSLCVPGHDALDYYNTLVQR